MSKIDKTELIAKLQQLEGLTDEEKSNLIGLLRQHKKYGLVWEDKPEDVEERLREELPVLKEVRERALISDQPDAPNHILIEGDNLEALTALSYTHEGKIDVIYIDPPYNTGNKDFVYNDSYVDTEDSYRHSKWLSFMSKRLRIAKRLLSDKGVIFISIDDNEQANLKLLCDDVFGERNFVTNFVWQSTPGSNTGTEIKTVTENILLYARCKENFVANTRNIADTQKYTLEDEYVQKRGKYVLNKLDRRMTGSHYSEALNYQIKTPDNTLLFPGSSNTKLEHWNWRWSEQKVKWGIENGFIVFKQIKGIWSIYFKQYQFVNNNDEQIVRSLPFQNLLDDDDSFNAARGSSDLMNVLSAKLFDYPKPLSLITRVLEIATAKDSIILDFFAGSGTTLHATIKLNAEDGGHRQCILVTNNENGICEQVTYERNKRVIQGYTTPKGQAVEGLHNNNLRYYRTEFIPRERTQRNMRALVNAATDLLCVKEDLYQELPIDALRHCEERSNPENQLPVGLAPRHVRLFCDGTKSMMVIYDERAIPYIVNWLNNDANSKLSTLNSKLKIYVFAPGPYAWDDDFAPVIDRVELCALPEAIYQAYKNVLPKKRNKYADEESTNGVDINDF